MIFCPFRSEDRCLFKTMELSYSLFWKCQVKDQANRYFLISVSSSAHGAPTSVDSYRVIFSGRTTGLLIFPVGVIQPFSESVEGVYIRLFFSNRESGLKRRGLFTNFRRNEVRSGTRRRILSPLEFPTVPALSSTQNLGVHDGDYRFSSALLITGVVRMFIH